MDLTINAGPQGTSTAKNDIDQVRELVRMSRSDSSSISEAFRRRLLTILSWLLNKLTGQIERDLGGPVDFHHLTEEQVAHAEKSHPLIKTMLISIDEAGEFDEEERAILGEPVDQLRRWEATLDAVATPAFREALQKTNDLNNQSKEEWVRY